MPQTSCPGTPNTTHRAAPGTGLTDLQLPGVGWNWPRAPRWSCATHCSWLLGHHPTSQSLMGATGLPWGTVAQGLPSFPSFSFTWGQLVAQSGGISVSVGCPTFPLQHHSPIWVSSSQRIQTNTTSASSHVSSNSLRFPNEIPLTYDHMNSKRFHR